MSMKPKQFSNISKTKKRRASWLWWNYDETLA